MDAVDDALALWYSGDRVGFRLALHPYLHWTTADGDTVRGRDNVLTLLEARADGLRRPASYELRDGQIYRWTE